MNRRVLGGTVLAIAACFAQACTADPSAVAGAVLASKSADSAPLVRLPDGLDVLQIRQGASMDSANQALADIVASLPASKHLHGMATTDASSDAVEPEPPLAAQKNYLAARLAWREGLQYDAIKKLHDARRLAPNDAAIYRALGRIYDMQGNKDQSHHHFERAAELDPRDPYTLFMLARLEMDRGHVDEAILLMGNVVAQAEASDEGRIGFLPLTHLFLGSALQQKGFDRAAAIQWRQFLEARIRLENFSGRLRMEAHHLRRRRQLLWQRLGDAHHRLAEPAAALEAYMHAATQGQTPSVSLASRLVYTLMLTGREHDARDVVMRFASVGGDVNDSAKLIDYLVTVSTDRTALVDDLGRLYLDTQRSTAALLALVRLLPAEQREQLLADHLAERPSDRVVFEAYIRAELTSGDVDRVQRSLEVAAIAIGHFPPATNAYIATLFEGTGDRVALLSAAEAASSSSPDPAMQSLYGHLLLRTGAVDAASAAFRRTLELDPQWHAARLDLGEILIEVGRFDDAVGVLSPLADAGDPRALALQGRVLHETGQTEAAAQWVTQALQRHPNHADLVVLKARMDRQAGRWQDAEGTLLALIKARPSVEQAYASLIDLYLFDRPPEWKQRHAKIVRRLRQKMPHCQAARRERARQLFSSGEHKKSEHHLRDLLQEDATDLRTLRVLLAVLAETDRVEDGIDLIDQWAEGNARKRAFRNLTEQFFLEVVLSRLRAGAHEQVVEHVDRAMERPLMDPRTLLWIQRRTLVQLGRSDDVEPKLRTAAARFPDYEPDLLLTWAMTLEQLDQADRAIAIMEEVLARHPDHAATRNSLGYTWADRGRRLEEAERLVAAAVEVEPGNPAYLDSLGWVYYKRGRFDEAVEQLSKASLLPGGGDPVILDHLGDALYRLKRRDEASRYWREALQAITPEAQERDGEMKRLWPRLTAKLQAVEGRQVVPVAASPGAAPDVEEPSVSGP